MRRGRASGRLSGLLAAACVAGSLLAGCSGTDDAPAPEVASPRPQIELGFTQLLPDEGTLKALLRVVNISDYPLPVTAAGLDWPGYGGGFTSPQDATLAPGTTLDLQVRLPTPDCGADADLDVPVVGVVRTADHEVEQPLEDSGQVFVRRLHDTWCADQLLAENVVIGYDDDWRLSDDVRGEPAATGSLVLTRRGGTEAVEVVATDGSVLYDLAVGTPITVPASRAETRVEAAILPGNRCDEHARGQATAPWTLALTVDVGEGDAARRARVLVEPPARVRQLATRALDEACVLRAGR